MFSSFFAGRKFSHHAVILIILFLIFSSSLSLINESYAESNLNSQLDHREDFVRWTNMLNFSRIVEHVKFFSSLETRATGYPGNEVAASYIYNKFREFGLANVTYDYYSLAVCVSRGANVTLESGQILRIHPLKPNFVVPSATSPEGIEGELVYVGEGNLQKYKESVEGKIVLMDWNSEDRWIDAAKLGARAVIFLYSDRPVNLNDRRRIETTEALYGPDVKFLARTPLLFPRFYAEENESKILLEHLGERVKLKSTHVWENVTTQNVMGFVWGEDPKYSDLIFLITAYYDSGDLVATYSPGAQESLGISTLLEYARLFQEEKPKFSILFVAFGAHHQSFEGAFHFVSEYWWPAANLTKREIGLRIQGNWLNIDISTGTSTVFLMSGGSAQQVKHLISYFSDLESHIREYAPYGEQYQFDKYMGTEYLVGEAETVFPYAFPTVRFHYEHEVDGWAGSIGYTRGITFTTMFDTRPYYNNPFDTLDKVNFGNLLIQARLIYLIIRSYLEDYIDIFSRAGMKIPVIETEPIFKTEGLSWGNLTGTVVEWDKSKGFWVPITKEKYGSDFPNPLVVLYAPGRERFRLADDEGRFNFIGGIWYFYGGGPGIYQVQKLEAWVIDPKTGGILFAPDMGTHKYPNQDKAVMIRSPTGEVKFGYYAIFNASTMAIFDFFSPKTLSTPREEAAAGAAGISGAATIPLVASILKADTQVQPESWAYFQEPNRGICIVAAEPGLPITITAKRMGARYPEILLSNASDEKKLGIGYRLEVGKQLLIDNTALKYARDFYYVNQERYETLSESMHTGAHILPAYDIHLEVERLISKSMEKAKSGNIFEAYSDSLEAWSTSVTVYRMVRGMSEDSAYVVPFIAFLLIPFALLAERLIFHLRGYKRIASLIGVIAFTLIFFSLFHPGFKLAASPLSIIIGFSVLILASPIIAVILADVRSLIKELRLKYLGRHEVEAGGASILIHDFTVGVENLRRRPLRTLLTLFSVIIMIMSLVGFTSLGSIPVTLAASEPNGVPVYDGIYVHYMQWGRGSEDMGEVSRDFISETMKDVAIIAQRAWRYTNYRDLLPPIAWPGSGHFRIVRGNLTTYSRALLGLSASEPELTKVDVLLVAGRWFTPYDRFTCILNEYQAEKLQVNVTNFVPTTIEIEGMNFTVVGVVKNDIESLVDLDGEPIMPLKYDFPPGLPNPWNQHLRYWETLILDYPTVTLMGGDTVSVSAKFINATEDTIIQYAHKLYSVIPALTIYTSFGEKVFRIGSGTTVELYGFEMQFVPTVMVVLVVFNILLGGVYQRRREIFIYSSVGVSPRDISILFLAESIVYALVGGVLGYVFGVLGLVIVPSLFPEFTGINFSSGMVISAIGGSMLATILSALYPAYISSRLVTPSLERKWKIPTKPVGNSWEIPLPFIATSDGEMRGIINFIEEFLRAHMQPDAPILSVTTLDRIEGTRMVHNRELPFYGLTVECRLSPYGLGLMQKMEIFSTKITPTRWQFSIVITRVAGSVDDWIRLNRTALNSIRQQFLLWRSLKDEEKNKYIPDVKTLSE